MIENSAVVIESFIDLNMTVTMQEENKVSNFKSKHGRFVKRMTEKDFVGFLKGATLEKLTKNLNAWVSKDFTHITSASGKLVAAYGHNAEAFKDFQTLLMRNSLMDLGNNTTYLPTKEENKTIESALLTYRNECIPYVIGQCQAKLAVAIPDTDKRTAAIAEQLQVVANDEIAAVKALEDKDSK